MGSIYLESIINFDDSFNCFIIVKINKRHNYRTNSLPLLKETLNLFNAIAKLIILNLQNGYFILEVLEKIINGSFFY